MLKLILVSGSWDRLSRIIDTAVYEVEVSRLDEPREERDDGLPDDRDVMPGSADE